MSISSVARRRFALGHGLVLVLGLVSAICIAVAVPAQAFEVPYRAARVTDPAELLDEAEEARLDAKLANLERQFGAQVAVLLTPSLEGEVLEDVSLRVAEAWQLGREEHDDGILILVARDERQIRIEVGYGLEGALTDLQAKRIIEGLMVPRFREGDYAGGVEAAVDAVAGVLRGDPHAVPPRPVRTESRGIHPSTLFLFAVFFLLFAWPALALPGFMGWFYWFLLAPLLGIGAAGALGPIWALWLMGAWLVVGAVARIVWPKAWRIRPSRGSGSGGGTFWTSGGGGGFSSGGFSGGGGGFSGGGGSFGGGGASGRW